jgi:hypothetical protein
VYTLHDQLLQVFISIIIHRKIILINNWVNQFFSNPDCLSSSVPIFLARVRDNYVYSFFFSRFVIVAFL